MKGYRPSQFKSIFLCLLLIAGLVMAVSCGGGSSASDPPSNQQNSPDEFLYATSTNQIFSFPIDPATGALGAATTTHGPSTGLGLFTTMVADRSGKFLFVLDFSKAAIATFSINPSSGALLKVGESPFPLGLPDLFASIGIDPKGRFVYVTGTFGISSFTISTTGELTEIGLPVKDFTGLAGVIAEPSGRFLYSTELSLATATISIYSVDSAGVLSKMPLFGVPALDEGLTTMAAHPSGKFFYMGFLPSKELLGFSIDDTTGLPGFLSGSPYIVSSTENTVSSSAITPDGHWMFVSSVPGGVITTFVIDDNGNLIPTDQNPLVTEKVAPTTIVVEPKGKFLYAAGPSGVLPFKIDQVSGMLTQTTGAMFPVGAGLTLPATIVVVKTK